MKKKIQTTLEDLQRVLQNTIDIKTDNKERLLRAMKDLKFPLKELQLQPQRPIPKDLA